MSSSLVWVRLHYKGKDKPEGNPIKIRPVPDDVADLARRLKENDIKNRLSHCDVDEIDIYPPKSSGDREKQYGPDKEMKEVIAELEKEMTPPTSGKHPLIVVAPDPNQQPANGKVVEFIFNSVFDHMHCGCSACLCLFSLPYSINGYSRATATGIIIRRSYCQNRKLSLYLSREWKKFWKWLCSVQQTGSHCCTSLGRRRR